MSRLPPAITTAPAVSRVPAEVATWNLPLASDAQFGDFLAQMKRGFEGLGLLQQSIDQLLRAANRQCRNVIDRLIGIQLGALAAGLAPANR